MSKTVEALPIDEQFWCEIKNREITDTATGRVFAREIESRSYLRPGMAQSVMAGIPIIRYIVKLDSAIWDRREGRAVKEIVVDKFDIERLSNLDAIVNMVFAEDEG